MSSVLNLSSADDSGFEPVKSSIYDAVVTGCKPAEIKNESGEGKYPAGTPGYNVEWTFDYEGKSRKVWNNYWLPEADYIATLDESERKKVEFTIGRFVRLLTAAGNPEKDVKSGKFKFDADEHLVGRRMTISVGIQPAKDGYDARNIVRDTRPLQAVEAGNII